ncbi:lachesin-like [Leguminivora glycinivorella]|uniref:lachesin-like n=1 Tax=Leguminivora glycinivorella TaxID=1035111 RepID=UPI002010C14B|nr:lachesin-like [Leguminivora glycinivorella]XP_047998924.1 lachesin-like [Leguminivora glycinivorella]XP_047998933.1 lachesin-like [Leguminivora glycinivorella]
MTPAGLLVFSSLLTRTLCVIAPQIPDFSTGEKKVVNGPFWHEVITELYEDHEDDVSTTTTEPLPIFEDDASTNNVTAQLGSRVHLHCRVHDLGEKTISWVKRRDDELHLLSFGRHTYSADSRYSLAFEHPNNWRLLIQYVSERDEGFYECQISTHPPLVRRVHLSVVVPKVEIIDERGRPLQDKFYKEGSIIELRCIVSEVPQPTRQVNWKHGARLLNYDTKRGGISVKTEATANGALSRLYIANANRQDSGNYTCSLADVAASAVSVHVLRGENPLAMQRGGSVAFSHPTLTLLAALAS